MARVSAIDVLQVDYEYVTIRRYVEGTRDATGAASRTLTTMYENVKCSIDPTVRFALIGELAQRSRIMEQGQMQEQYIYLCFNQSTDILQNDIVVDADGNSYEISLVADWRTHKDTFGRKL